MMNPVSPAMEQDLKGYRYNQDSFLLASFYRQKMPGLLADFCAGTGVVSILVGARRPGLRIVALEMNFAMAAQARRNAASYGLSSYQIIAADIMSAPDMFKGRPFGAIIANPPYRKSGHGRLNQDQDKAMARHEVAMTLAGMVDAAARLLVPGGALTLVMLQSRREEYLELIKNAGFVEARFRHVRYRATSPSKIFLSEAVLGECPHPAQEPDLVIAQGDGWTREYQQIVEQYGR